MSYVSQYEKKREFYDVFREKVKSRKLDNYSDEDYEIAEHLVNLFETLVVYGNIPYKDELDMRLELGGVIKPQWDKYEFMVTNPAKMAIDEQEMNHIRDAFFRGIIDAIKYFKNKHNIKYTSSLNVVISNRVEYSLSESKIISINNLENDLLLKKLPVKYEGLIEAKSVASIQKLKEVNFKNGEYFDMLFIPKRIVYDYKDGCGDFYFIGFKDSHSKFKEEYVKQAKSKLEWFKKYEKDYALNNKAKTELSTAAELVVTLSHLFKDMFIFGILEGEYVKVRTDINTNTVCTIVNPFYLNNDPNTYNEIYTKFLSSIKELITLPRLRPVEFISINNFKIKLNFGFSEVCNWLVDDVEADVIEAPYNDKIKDWDFYEDVINKIGEYGKPVFTAVMGVNKERTAPVYKFYIERVKGE